MRLFFYLSILFFLTANSQMNAQGCSDAGVCSLNALKPKSETDYSINHFKIGASNGLADHDIAVFGAYVEYGRRFSKRFAIDAKLAAMTQSGNDITVSGLSDLYLNANYSTNEKMGFILGLKIPMNKADRKKDGLPLPMDYQSSLGTLDLILGISRQFGKLMAVAAYQQPLTQNGNAFMADEYPLGSKLIEFQSTNQFERKGDVLLRISYPLVFGKVTITPSLLPIYHLGTDLYYVGNHKAEINGSDGFTLNGNVFVDYHLNDKNNLQLSLASPFIVRDTRPDGLTRGYVVGLEYGIRF
ncbi:MAG: hypothetical protein GC192_00465 [Bacteroidetes bacterium]|nr:hypothetical protein [Bacteroidota bacterium]